MSFIPIGLSNGGSGDGLKLNVKFSLGNWFSIDEESKVVKVWIIGAIGSLTDYSSMLAMIHALTEDYVLHIYIHSPGGYIPTAAYIISGLDQCKAHVITHNVGLAASAGSLILCCGDTIEVSDNAVTMFHSSGFSVSSPSHLVKTNAEHLIAYVDTLFAMMKSRGLLTEEEYLAITTRGAEFYFTSSEMRQRLAANGGSR